MLKKMYERERETDRQREADEHKNKDYKQNSREDLHIT